MEPKTSWLESMLLAGILSSKKSKRRRGKTFKGGEGMEKKS